MKRIYLALVAAVLLASPALAQQTTINGVYNSAGVTAANGQPTAAQMDAFGSIQTINSCVYNSTMPTYTTGQRTQCQAQSNGVLRVQITDVNNGLGGVNAVAVNADAASPDIAVLNVGSYGLLYNGATWDRARGNVNGAAISKGVPSTRWRYTSGVTGILSNTTTGVTIKAAVASVKNAIDSCQITTTAFGASVPLVIRDGAAGTVMFALTVPTAGFLQPVTIVFDQPLVGTANTLTEIATTTANTTGTVTANCQGHTET